MKNFWHRLKFYLFGVLLGSVIVYYTLIKGKNRNLDAWLPDGRVALKISSAELSVSDEFLCLANCYELTDSTSLSNLLNNADVLFDESQQNATPKVFVMETTKPELKLTFELQDDKARLTGVKELGDSKKCDC